MLQQLQHLGGGSAQQTRSFRQVLACLEFAVPSMYTCSGTLKSDSLWLHLAVGEQGRQPQYGAELTAEQWQPWDFDPLDLSPQHFAVRLISFGCQGNHMSQKWHAGMRMHICKTSMACRVSMHCTSHALE